MKDRKSIKISGKKILQGIIKIPGDKSISHRSVILGSLNNKSIDINNILISDDIKSTIKAFRQMGVKIDVINKKKVRVYGVGINGLAPSKDLIDCGNSGTTMRLLTGLLSGQSFNSTLVGDESLSLRPMGRVIKPLSLMGAKIKSNNSKPPLKIKGSNKLKPIKYEMEVESAQVKSAILLASLSQGIISKVIENNKSRNHTEIMIDYFTEKNFNVDNLFIPGDISSASYFIGLALIAEGSNIVLHNIGLNPTRAGIIKIFKIMGADISIANIKKVNGELIGTIEVISSKLKGIEVPKEIIPNIIDDIPILAVVASFSQGETILRGARELRVKESDRIKVLVEGLSRFGVDIEEFEDGFKINPKSNYHPAKVNSYNDHRMAMAFSIMASCIDGVSEVFGYDSVKVSFPNFYKILKSI